MLASQVTQTGFSRPYHVLVGRAGTRECKSRRLDAILQFADDLTSTNDIATIDIETRDHSDDGAGQPDNLLRLDHTFEFGRVRN